MRISLRQLTCSKPLLFLFCWLGSLPLTWSQTARTGIQFRSGDFNQALAQAKGAHKPLLVEVYLTGCPHCEALAPILTEKPVGDFYNTHFVSWQVEANSPASVAMQKAKQLTYPEFPLLLFFDPEGNLVHQATPADEPAKAAAIDQLIAIGRMALDPSQRMSSYAARFEAGERDAALLINYGKYCKTRKDDARLHQVSIALGSVLTSPEQIKSAVGFYCLQRLIDDVENPMAQYFFAHLAEFRASFPAKDVKEAGEGLIFRSLYGPKGDQYTAQQVVKMREAMVGLGVPAIEAAPRTLLKELDAHLRANDTPAAVQRFNLYRQQAKGLGAADYAYLMHYFNEKAKDGSYLTQMPIWAGDGLKNLPATQQSGKPVADLYYELAVAYQKQGQKALALQAAQKGLAAAKVAKLDAKRYEEQIARLN